MANPSTYWSGLDVNSFVLSVQAGSVDSVYIRDHQIRRPSLSIFITAGSKSGDPSGNFDWKLKPINISLFLLSIVIPPIPPVEFAPLRYPV